MYVCSFQFLSFFDNHYTTFYVCQNVHLKKVNANIIKKQSSKCLHETRHNFYLIISSPLISYPNMSIKYITRRLYREGYN